MIESLFCNSVFHDLVLWPGVYAQGIQTDSIADKPKFQAQPDAAFQGSVPDNSMAKTRW